jgi:hypothetical protein
MIQLRTLAADRHLQWSVISSVVMEREFRRRVNESPLSCPTAK